MSKLRSHSTDVKEALREVLRESEVVDNLSANILDRLEQKIVALVDNAVRDKCEEYDNLLESLEARMKALEKETAHVNKLAAQRTDELEQYQRRTSLRFFGIPETRGEDTDEKSIVNGSKQDEFVDLFTNSGVDIIVVSETWLKDGNCVNLPNYNSYYVNRPISRSGGGVAIFVKECHSAKVITTSLGENNRPEYVLLEVLVGSNKILVAGIYRAPKVGFLDAFQDDIQKYSVNYKYVFVCGDLNARFNSGSEETKIICDVLGFCNLHCVPFGPTFHIPGCYSTLDIISSNCPNLLIVFGQKLASGFSAHDLLYAVYNLLVPPVRKQRITCRNFKHIVVDDLFNDLEKAPWEEIFNCNNIDSKLEKFNGIITDVMDKHAPLKTFTAKQPSQPWMTKCIRKLIKKRNKLRIKFLKTKSAPDHEKFKDIRNKVKQEIRSAKAKFFYSKFGMCMSSKSTWATIRSLNIANKSAPANLVVPVDILNEHYAFCIIRKTP
ncbi:RNA-directed DNA polymerase from mobile element jockey [Frankliniella fusca]|uniref:RNA-directed DNA polymerase from mobile element jockey n=1 Tax=Frankliniella fusca TaxID=407009 RepID=A0AAE1LSE7_9NEOP|nr:RNA-directed DNA polymerase from mobile element jockey [Frankliniella fusca]